MAGINRTTGKATDLITFSRASGGTALRKISYGSELVTNGGFDSADGWTGNATIAGGVCEFDATNDQITWTYDLKDGALYEISFDYVVTSGSTLRVYINDTVIADESAYSGSGTQSLRLIAGSANTNIQFRANTFRGTIDNISVKEVLFDQPDGTLTLFNHPTNIPRIEYDASGNVKGLLIEEARTNLVEWSEDFTQWNSVGAVTTTNTIEDTSPNSTHSITQAVSITSGDQYVLTASVKKEASYPNGFVGFTLNNGGISKNFDPVNGVLSTAGDGVGTVTDMGSDWLVSIVGTATATGSNNLTILPARNTVLETVSSLKAATGLITINYVQLEAGSFPTSYIPTSGATATRAADIASIPVSDFGYNQGVGSLVVDANPIPVGSGYGTKVIVNINDGGVASEISLLNENNDRFRLILDPEATTNDVDISISGAEGAELYAAGWKLNSTNAAHGGILGTEDTSNTPIKNATQMTLSSDANGNAKFSGHIKSIKYYPRKLTSAQLQELTS